MRRKRVPILPLKPHDIARFWAYVNKTDTCWLWTGPCNQGGYGMFRTYEPDHAAYRGIRNTSMLAHRVAWSLEHNAEIQEDLIMRHQCHNPPCVKADHLLTGTAVDNRNDMIVAGRQPAHGPMLGVTGVQHPASRYDAAIRQRALDLMFGEPPMKLQDIAALLGCSNKTIGRWRADFKQSGSYRWCRPTQES